MIVNDQDSLYFEKYSAFRYGNKLTDDHIKNDCFYEVLKLMSDE